MNYEWQEERVAMRSEIEMLAHELKMAKETIASWKATHDAKNEDWHNLIDENEKLKSTVVILENLCRKCQSTKALDDIAIILKEAKSWTVSEP